MLLRFNGTPIQLDLGGHAVAINTVTVIPGVTATDPDIGKSTLFARRRVVKRNSAGAMRVIAWPHATIRGVASVRHFFRNYAVAGVPFSVFAVLPFDRDSQDLPVPPND